MTQISRPFQIALGAVAVLALVWFAALRGHGSSSSEPAASTPSTSAPAKPAGASKPSSGSAAGQQRTAGAPSPVYHGAAPGVEGLTRDIAKAHGAVAVSQRNADQLQRSSAQASGEAPAQAGASATSPAGSHAAVSAPGKGVRASKPSNVNSTAGKRASSTGAHNGRGAGGSGRPARPAQQVQVERELTHGKTVVLVFWDPKSSVDVAVRKQALALAAGSKGKLAVHVAKSDQVGLFGPVTEVAHVYQTPTILIVSKHGLVSTLTGLTDVFSLQQAVREAEHAGH